MWDDLHGEVADLFAGLAIVDFTDIHVLRNYDDGGDGEAWIEGDAATRAEIERRVRARLCAPGAVSCPPESTRRLGRGPGRLRGDPPVPDIVHQLARVGCSVREIERRTGVGRNRIARALRG